MTEDLDQELRILSAKTIMLGRELKETGKQLQQLAEKYQTND